MLLITKHTIRLRVSHLHTRRHRAAGARPRTCGEGDGRSAAPDGHGSIHVAARHQPVGAPRRLLLPVSSVSVCACDKTGVCVNGDASGAKSWTAMESHHEVRGWERRADTAPFVRGDLESTITTS
jgi:hypothetical protein